MKLLIMIVILQFIEIKSKIDRFLKGNYLKENVFYKNSTRRNNLHNKISHILENIKESFPFPSITNSSTDIILKSDCNSLINENVTFLLENGIFSTVIKIVSLSGSSSNFTDFLISSK